MAKKPQFRTTRHIPDVQSLGKHWGADFAPYIRDLLAKHAAIFWPSKHFRNRFTHDSATKRFQAYWELYLYDVFQTAKLSPELNAKDEGPDFKCTLPDGRIMWVEAVAPSGGRSPRVQRYEDDLDNRQSTQIPTEALQARITKAFVEKNEQLCEKNKMRKEQDVNVIAINTAYLRRSGLSKSNAYPLVVDTCLGLGYPQATMNKGQGVERSKFLGFHIKQESLIHNENNAEIDVAFFLRDDFSGIGGVLFSDSHYRNAVKTRFEMGFVHNYKAQNSLAHGVFPVGEEYDVIGEKLVNIQNVPQNKNNM